MTEVPTAQRQGWGTRRLGDLGTVVRGGSPRPAGDPRYFNGRHIPWLTVAALTNISDSELRVSRTESSLTEEGAKRSRTLVPGTVIIANSGATLGVAKILDVKCCANDGIAAIINQREGDPEFVCHVINTMTQRLREVVASGNGQPNLNTALIRAIEIPFPPLPAQRAIAAALSDVDALIAALDQLIAKKRDLKTATMQQLLTGQRRLPGFTGAWQPAVLSDLLTQSATYGIVTAGSFVTGGGVPMIRGGDIKGGRVVGDLPCVSHEKSREYSRTVVERNDVVIALVGYPGEAARITDDLVGANVSRSTGLLRPRPGVSSDYLVAYLNSPIGRRVVLAPSAGSAQLVVNLADLNRLSFPLPPFDEQVALATFAADFQAELDLLEARREKTRLIKQGMMHELLTGRTRLVEAAP